jgi:alkylation response protein AidB-like acyl-CoA dehydrogenase
MDLELTDEQIWLSEAIDTLLEREAAGPQLWERLVEFGALDIAPEDGLGAVELCLIARALGAHLASAPYVGSAAVRFATGATGGSETDAVALLEPGGGWSLSSVRSTVAGGTLDGRKVAVEHGATVDRLAVVAMVGDEPGLALIGAAAEGVDVTSQPSLDETVPLAAVSLASVAVATDATAGPRTVSRLVTAGALLVCAEAIGAAGRMLEDARRYAGERRQFGHPIGSYQALRHLLADMYVRQASAWSTVLYAAAALDDDIGDPHQTAAVAKAYVARATREVAHGAMQVFGGIAFTEEHPAHRFLRRIVVREQQYGDAAHHESALGRTLAAASPTPAPVG